MSSHDEIVRQEFAKQAVTFEDPAYSFADQRLMGWILEHVPCEPGAMVLDAGGGTGHVARAYADIAALAVVLDVTEEMLVTGRGEAEASGLRNLLFMVGDATRMPFLDESFDLVVSRFAVHHFERPALQIAEIVRVCRAGSRVAIIDLVAADEALAAQTTGLRGCATRRTFGRFQLPSCRDRLRKPARRSCIRLFMSSRSQLIDGFRRRKRHQRLAGRSEASLSPSWIAARRPACGRWCARESFTSPRDGPSSSPRSQRAAHPSDR